jgi:hypothetical protein
VHEQRRGSQPSGFSHRFSTGPRPGHLRHFVHERDAFSSTVGATLARSRRARFRARHEQQLSQHEHELKHEQADGQHSTAPADAPQARDTSMTNERPPAPTAGLSSASSMGVARSTPSLGPTMTRSPGLRTALSHEVGHEVGELSFVTRTLLPHQHVSHLDVSRSIGGCPRALTVACPTPPACAEQGQEHTRAWH